MPLRANGFHLPLRLQDTKKKASLFFGVNREVNKSVSMLPVLFTSR